MKRFLIKIIFIFFISFFLGKTVNALTTTYDFTACDPTCDTSTSWWASYDDVDIFTFLNDTTNRNSHTENNDANYTSINSSNDSRQVSANPGTGDEIVLWSEMTINETPSTIGQINLVYEGYGNSTGNFGLYLKDDATAYGNDSAWTRIGTAESVTAATEETITRSIFGTDFANFIDSNGLLIWASAHFVSSGIINTDYVKIDVITHTVEQEGFRWRKDDGSESGASWLASQDTNISRSIGTTTRLRTILNDTASGNQDTTQYQLEYKISSDSKYRKIESSSSSLAYSSIGTASVDVTSVVSMTAPSTIEAGDLLIMAIANKYPTDGPATPLGWTAISNNQFSGGSGSSGLNSGSVYVTLFTREAEGWEDSAVFNAVVPSGNTAEGVIVRYTKGTGKEWDISATGGSDNSAGTSWSVTGASNPGITAGDILFIASASNSSLGSWSSQSVSATDVTIGTQTELYDGESGGGDSVTLVLSNHIVSSGTATAAPVFTMTGSASGANYQAGASAILRIREVDAPIQLSASSNITASGANTTAQLTVPSGAPSFTAGRIQDDENPADTVDINNSEYTEMEWSIIATDQAAVGEIYQFRVTANGQVLTTYTVTPQWTISNPPLKQSAYRFFNNANSTDVGSALANQDTSATLGSMGDDFRLRKLLHVYDATLAVSAENYKLQFATKSGTCDTAFSGESYANVTGATAIAYSTANSASDGDALTSNANDPTEGHTVVNQTYEEANNFTNSQASIPAGQDGKWDFSLIDNSALADTTYCFRVIKSDDSLLDSYSVIPEITTASAGASQTLTFSLSDNTIGFGTLSSSNARYATGDLAGSLSETEAHTFSASTNASGGYVITLNGNTLTYGSEIITAIGSSNTASSAGTEQFGLRMTATGGNGAVTAPYADTGFAFDSAAFPDQVASDADGDDVSTTYSVRYIGNISETTGAGTYGATLSYVITATF